MKQMNEKLDKIISKSPSKWRAKAEHRLMNKWLTYSSQIALRVLSAIGQKENFSQGKLAELLDVSPQYISKIVKGKENLSLETIYKLSQALETELISFPEYADNKVMLGANTVSIKASGSQFHLSNPFDDVKETISDVKMIPVAHRTTDFLLDDLKAV